MVKTKKVTLKYGEKKKNTAVWLAVLFSYWTYLYTYKEDTLKFWLMMIGCLTLWWTLIVPIGVWIFTIVETTRRPKEWYENYPY